MTKHKLDLDNEAPGQYDPNKRVRYTEQNLTECLATLRQLSLMTKNKGLYSHISVQINAVFQKLDRCLETEFSAWIQKNSHLSSSELRDHVSYIIYNCGHLSQFATRKDLISAQTINTLLTWLASHEELELEVISKIFYGVGLLAKNHQLLGSLDTRTLTHLFRSHGMSPSGFGSLLFGLALASQSNYLDDEIAPTFITEILREFETFGNMKASDASTCFHAFGLLAESQQVHARFPVSSLETQLVRRARDEKAKATYYSTILNGIGIIASTKKLEGSIDATIVQSLLKNRETSGDASYKIISSAFSGISFLAKSGHLKGAIQASYFNHLLSIQADFSDLDGQGVGVCVALLGELAQQDKLDGEIDLRVLHRLINRLVTLSFVDNRWACSVFSSIALLLQARKIAPEQVAPFRASLQPLLNHAFLRPLNAIQAEQLLLGLTELWPSITCSPTQLVLLLDCAITKKNYLHPKDIVALIHYLTYFRRMHQQLDNQFKTLATLITFPLDYLSPTDMNRVRNDLIVLDSVPESGWASRLRKQFKIEQLTTAPKPQAPEAIPAIAPVSISSPLTQRPQPIAPSTTPKVQQTPRHLSILAPITKPSTSGAAAPSSLAWNTAYNENPLFKAIADRNFQQLEQLLGVSLNAGKHHVVERSTSTSHIFHLGPNRRLEATRTNQIEADELVTKLLQETEAAVFSKLIERSPAKYFELLLRACTRHTRYQLAITNSLHTVILYLPIKELSLFIDYLHALEIYRDSQALLSILDALTLRALKTPENNVLIHKMKTELMEHGIEFHDKSNHHHVVPRLTDVKNKLQASAPKGSAALETAPTPMDTTIPTPLQRNSLLAPPRLRVNREYQYEVEDIERILRNRLSPLTNPGIKLLSSANMTEGFNGNRIADVLKQYMEGDEGQAMAVAPEQNIIIPILHRAHWVAIRLKLQTGTSPKVTYFNSIENYEPDEDLKPQILLEINTVLRAHTTYTSPSLTVSPKCLIQPDGSSCGPYLIENIYCDLKGAFWAASQSRHDLTTEIRQRHLRLLRETSPDYYTAFYERQSENRATISGNTSDMVI